MTQKEFPTKDYQKSYEDERDSINSKDFMIGALIGGMIGAATALFMAPKRGWKKVQSLLILQKKKQTPSRKSFQINLRISSTK